jgi:hypothetical protein
MENVIKPPAPEFPYAEIKKLEIWAVKMIMPNITPLLIRKLEDVLEEEAAVFWLFRQLPAILSTGSNHIKLLLMIFNQSIKQGFWYLMSKNPAPITR